MAKKTFSTQATAQVTETGIFIGVLRRKFKVGGKCHFGASKSRNGEKYMVSH